MLLLFKAYCLFALTTIGGGHNRWEVDTVLTGQQFFGCGIALDALDNPHIAFGTESRLGYARWDGTGWNVEYPDDVNAGAVRLRLGGDGLTHIGYDAVRYARWDGANWHTEIVSDGTELLSLALARDNSPHMVFSHSDTVKYAYKAGDTWSILTVPTEQTDTLRRLISGSLALDTTDRPGIAVSWYKRECAPGGLDSVWLAVFEYDGQSWHRFEADSSQGWGIYDFWRPGIQCDPATDLFHITHRSYRYVTGRGHNWQAEWSGDVSVGRLCYGFALHEGRPHIACASNWYPLRYQWRGAGGWEEELVDSMMTTIGAVSIAVDRTGRPHVALACPWGGLFYYRRLFVGIQEPAPPQPAPAAGIPTIVRGSLFLRPVSCPDHTHSALCLCGSKSSSALLDASGRKVMELVPGENDVRHLSPGVYFIREKGSRIKGAKGSGAKVVIQR